jgi:hypothetical protein
MLHKDYNRKCSVEKNIGRESQWAWRPDEMIGGKSDTDCEMWFERWNIKINEDKNQVI